MTYTVSSGTSNSTIPYHTVGNLYEKKWGDAAVPFLPFHLSPSNSSPPLPCPALPCREEVPWNQLWAWGSAVSSCSVGRDEAPATNVLWCILSLKIAPDSNGFYRRRKKKNHSCIGKKCQDGVPACKYVAERASGTFWLGLSTADTTSLTRSSVNIGILVSKGWRETWQPSIKVTWSKTRFEDSRSAWGEQVHGMW